MSASEVQAGPNINATLPCNVTLSPSMQGDKMNKSLLEVHWTRNSSDVASYIRGAEQVNPGFSWDTQGFNNGDFSLTVLRTSLGLQGVYTCTVNYNYVELDSSNVTLSILGM